MPEPKILDEGAVSEIEARPFGAMNVVTVERVLLTPAERDALCATVKHLRAEVTDYETTDLVPRSRYAALNADWLEARQQTTDLADRAGKEIESLQSQLEQLRASVDKFSTLADERHDLLSAERRANDSLRQHVDESMRTNEKLTARNVDLRQQLAQVKQERDALRDTIERLKRTVPQRL